MPADPIEELVELGIVDRLGQITPGPTYWSTISELTRSLRRYEYYATTLTEQGLPSPLDTGAVVGVMRTPGGEVTLESHDVSDDNPDAGYGGQIAVAIIGFVRGDATTIAATKLNNLRRDIRYCLHGDMRLGGLVMRLYSDGPDDNDGGMWEPDAGFSQVWVARV